MPRDSALGKRMRLEPDVQEGGLEGDWPPKWLTTYSDMVTLLLTFFVLWYANKMLNIPEEFVDLADETTFEVKPGQMDERSMMITTDIIDARSVQIAQELTPRQKLALTELSELREKAEDIRNYVREGELGEIEIKVVGEDVVIIPTAPLLFPEGSARVREEFFPVLDKIAQMLKDNRAAVRVEGHTDDVPIHPRHREVYPSNWELSSARAISVGRYLIDAAGVRPEKISVCGYADTFPRLPNDSEETRALNRRVEFHIYLTSDMS